MWGNGDTKPGMTSPAKLLGEVPADKTGDAVRFDHVGLTYAGAGAPSLCTTDYNGAGAAVIEAAIDGEAVPYAFLLKMLFTALTLGAGFKGGEIVPIFFTGATFGCVAAPLLGLPPQLGAALGMVALFCGCTNSPLASICLAIEVFGGQCVSLFALACAVSYMLSSYFSLYREQHFLHSKLRIVGVQRVHGHWSETDAAYLTTNGDGEN